ncbi:MAG: hypothetical protein AVDCRST_MAG55-162, partial [uncultured Rubrobacteraceae bacterium]
DRRRDPRRVDDRLQRRHNRRVVLRNQAGGLRLFRRGL